MESLDEYCRSLERNNERNDERKKLFMNLLIYLRGRRKNGKSR